VLGRYRLGPVLGRGATSWVYRADDSVSDRQVAVKAIPVELGLAGRAGAEVRAAARLDHPGVVRLLDWGEDQDALYLVWELVEGESLAALLRRGAPKSRVSVRLMCEVLETLAHAHRRGVVHRDVKPGNILVDRSGRTRLSDFGVARLSGESGLTRTGAVVGTMSYMAPEQATGGQTGAPADVYSACLVLWECLTGANPLAAPSPAETARRAAAGVGTPLRRLRPDLPAALCKAVDAGLRVDPARRPSTREVARSLRAALPRSGSSTGALRSWPTLASAAGGAALAAVALALVLEASAPLTLAGAAVAAAAFAFVPGPAAACALAGGVALVARTAPAAGLLVGALGLVVLALGWHRPRLLLLPAAAPALFLIGLGPLYAVAAGLVRPWTARLWAAVAGVLATLGWQILAGSSVLLLADVEVRPALRALEGMTAPVVAARRLSEPVRNHPEALAAAGVLVLAAMLVPLLVRARPGGQRIVLVAGWILGLSAAQIALTGAAGRLVETLLPSCIILAAWAARPWRPLAGRAEARAVRGPAT
jgi:hypothetical protein